MNISIHELENRRKSIYEEYVAFGNRRRHIKREFRLPARQVHLNDLKKQLKYIHKTWSIARTSTSKRQEVTNELCE